MLKETQPSFKNPFRAENYDSAFHTHVCSHTCVCGLWSHVLKSFAKTLRAHKQLWTQIFVKSFTWAESKAPLDLYQTAADGRCALNGSRLTCVDTRACLPSPEVVKHSFVMRFLSVAYLESLSGEPDRITFRRFYS